MISDDDVEMYEIWLKRAASNLHENHYLILGVKYTLSLLYGKIPGYMIQEMNEDLLRRKVTICEDLLKVADIIEPGLSRLRGKYVIENYQTMKTIHSTNDFFPLRNGIIRITRAINDVNVAEIQITKCIEETTQAFVTKNNPLFERSLRHFRIRK